MPFLLSKCLDKEFKPGSQKDDGENVRSHYEQLGISRIVTKAYLLRHAELLGWTVPPELDEWDDDMSLAEKLRWYRNHVIPKDTPEKKIDQILKERCCFVAEIEEYAEHLIGIRLSDESWAYAHNSSGERWRVVLHSNACHEVTLHYEDRTSAEEYMRRETIHLVVMESYWIEEQEYRTN